MKVKRCAECAKKDAVIAALQTALARNAAPKEYSITIPSTPIEQIDQTRFCPCRPENGGSGICGCIMGGLQVVC